MAHNERITGIVLTRRSGMTFGMKVALCWRSIALYAVCVMGPSKLFWA